MAITAKEKDALEQQWEGAKEGGADMIPDATWQFEIVGFEVVFNSKNTPMVNEKLKVIGGNEDYLDHEFVQRQNLTEVGMSILKKNLRTLEVESPDSLNALMSKPFWDKMIGIKYSAESKEKKGFLNIYVNSLIEGTGSPAAESEPEPSAEADPAPESNGAEDPWEKGDTVKWTKKNIEGEFIEFIDDGAKARVRLDSDDKVYPIPVDQLEMVYDDPPAENGKDKDSQGDPDPEPEPEDTGTSRNGSTPSKVPTPDAVQEMRRPQLNDALKDLGLKHTTLKQPRETLEAIAKLVHDANAKLGVKDVTPLANALGLKFKRGTAPQAASRAVRKAVKDRFGAAA